MTYAFVAGIFGLCFVLLSLQYTAMKKGWCKFEVGVDDEYYDNIHQQAVEEHDEDTVMGSFEDLQLV